MGEVDDRQGVHGPALVAGAEAPEVFEPVAAGLDALASLTDILKGRRWTWTR